MFDSVTTRPMLTTATINVTMVMTTISLFGMRDTPPARGLPSSQPGPSSKDRGVEKGFHSGSTPSGSAYSSSFRSIENSLHGHGKEKGHAAGPSLARRSQERGPR